MPPEVPNYIGSILDIHRVALLPHFDKIAAGLALVQILKKESGDVVARHLDSAVEPHSLGIDPDIAFRNQDACLYTIE